MSIDRSPMTDAISLHAIRMMRLAAQDLSQLSAIADAQTGAALSVMELSKVSVGLGHALAHVLGGRCGTPHSLNHGLVVAAVMRFNLPVVALQQRMIAEAFGVETKGLSDNAAAWEAVCAVKELVHRMGAPKGLRELGVLESDLPILADMVMDDKYSHTNPRKVTPVEALEVLKWAWTGEIPAPDGL